MLLTIVTTNRKSSSTNVAAIAPEILAELATHNLNICNAIKTLSANGFSNAQIIKAGYNASTVYRQVAEYKLQLAAQVAAETEQ